MHGAPDEQRGERLTIAEGEDDPLSRPRRLGEW